METELGSHTSSLTGTNSFLRYISSLACNFYDRRLSPDSCHYPELPILPSRSELLLLPAWLEINLQGEARQSFRASASPASSSAGLHLLWVSKNKARLEE